MEKVFTQIAHLFLESVPTIIFVFIIFLVLDRVLFRPLTRVLEERDRMTRGAVERAAKHTEQAEAKTADYDRALQQVQQEIYRRREVSRRQALAQRDEILKQARRRAEDMVSEEREGIARNVEAVKGELSAETQALARQISQTVLEVTS